MPSITAPESFASHHEWLMELHAAHAEHMARATRSPAPASRGGALPAPPTMWAEEVDTAGGDRWAPGAEAAMQHTEMAFGNIALDGDDFDAPVYRSFGDVVFTEDSGSWASDEDFEGPVYRSLDMGPAAAPAVMSAEEADRKWLETMPPLIRRQQARGASVAF